MRLHANPCLRYPPLKLNRCCFHWGLAENEKGIGVVDGPMIDGAVARRARRGLAPGRWMRMENDVRLGTSVDAPQG